MKLWSNFFSYSGVQCFYSIFITCAYVFRSPRAHSCGPCSHQPFFFSVEQGEAPPLTLLHPASICHIHRPGSRRPGKATKRGRHKDRHLHAGQRFAICQPGILSIVEFHFVFRRFVWLNISEEMSLCRKTIAPIWWTDHFIKLALVKKKLLSTRNALNLGFKGHWKLTELVFYPYFAHNFD